ncbi:MAG TPA: hypothetical protein VMU84_09685 [Thermoanaerobaculia bacterium]|nr:hypothetical protein [Thermoanaerobaculia bacterium]
MVSKEVRLREFFRRLELARAASSDAEALELIAAILTSVEDELTGVPADPSRWMTDGRMYPPQPDSRRDVPGHDTVTRYRSRAHNTFIGKNGAVEIRHINDDVLFRKAGLDGRHVWEQ